MIKPDQTDKTTCSFTHLIDKEPTYESKFPYAVA